MDRNAQLLNGIEKSMRGVEISPYFSPMTPKANGWKTVVVSNADGETQRRDAANHSAEIIRSLAHQIEDVDVIWTGGDLAELCLAIEPQGFDYIISSHVIEHVPDLLGVLLQFERMLTPNGVVSMAVPDLRTEFDFFRSPSDTADVIQAHLEKRTRHSPKTIFRQISLTANVDGAAAWTRSNTGAAELTGRLARGYQQMQLQQQQASQPDAPYVDAHAWTFVPASFKLIMHELAALQLISLEVSFIEINEGSEFVVQLRHRRDALPSEEDQELTRQALVREVLAELQTRQRNSA